MTIDKEVLRQIQDVLVEEAEFSEDLARRWKSSLYAKAEGEATEQRAQRIRLLILHVQKELEGDA